MRRLAGRARRGWVRFFFEQRSVATIALVRIAFGAVATLWTLSLVRDLDDLFGGGAVVADPPAFPAWFGLLDLAPGATLALWALTLVASVALTIGLFSRLAAVLVFLGIHAFHRRNPWAFNSGDDLLRITALFLALAPTGLALSLDRRRRGEPMREFPRRAPWPLRLIQIQLAVLYLANAWSKLRGARWNDGTAVSYSLRIEDYQRFGVPAVLTDALPLVNVLTWATVALEGALGILVWKRRARPWVLGAGVLFHLGIEWSLAVGFFGAAVLVCYLAFVPPDAAERFVRRLLR